MKGAAWAAESIFTRPPNDEVAVIRWSENEGSGDSSYVSRVDEIPG
jgi:hypothetical protein